MPAEGRNLKARLLPLPACGERVGVSGESRSSDSPIRPPQPLAFATLRRATSPRTRGEVKRGDNPDAVPRAMHGSEYRPPRHRKRRWPGPAHACSGPSISPSTSINGPHPPSIMRRAHAQVQENQQLFDRNFFTTKHSARSLFLKPQRLYSKCWGNPAMAINGRRNKPFGPGGSTRRLHPSSLSLKVSSR